MIEDKELRSLFKAESEERLQHLDNGLLQLEKTPTDPSLLEDLFREAHSLKGAARMLGLLQIQTLAHQLEDALGAARKNEAGMLPDAVSAMSHTLEAIRAMVRNEVGEAQTSEPAAEARAPEPQVSSPAVPSRPTPSKPEAFRISTIRVDPRRLDALLTQSGELTVTTIRIVRRLSEIDGLLDYCDEWDRAVRSESPSAQPHQIAPRLQSLKELLAHLRNGTYEDSARLDFVAGQLGKGIRALRLVPISALFVLFPRAVHDLARDQHKEVELLIEGEEAVADKHVLEEMKDPLMHILRNAIDHGIEAPEQREQAGKPRTGTIRLTARQPPSSIIIEIADDGRGLDLDSIKRTALKRGMHREEELAAMTEAQIQSLILAPGFSTSAFITDVSGRGVGLDVVRNKVEQLKGSLQIDSVPGRGLTLRIQLPVSLATARVLIASMNGRRYALPVEHVQFSRKVQPHELYTMEGRPTISVEGQPVTVDSLAALLDMTDSLQLSQQSVAVCVVLEVGANRFGLLVDELVDELEVVLKPQSRLLKRVRNVSGATILDTGEVCVVLNPHDLFKTLRKKSFSAAPLVTAAVAPKKKVLLLAEDSITTRTQEKRILEGAGYEVVTAVDGVDAYNKLGTRSFDGVVSDIMMPNMTGLTLTEKIRADKKYAELPIILVTSLASEEDKRRGMEAGANAYIPKPSFDQRLLLDCLARLI